MVGYLTSTDSMFHRDGYSGTESHFGVGGKWGGDAAKGYDGMVFQWQDTSRQADANGPDGNHRVISIETADNAPQTVEALAEWTPKQVTAIARVVAWACQVHDIPPVLVPDSKPGRRGIAYHRQGCLHSDGLGSHPGWLVAGGERWSQSKGKGCPGPKRIAQIQSEIIPRVKALLNPPPKPSPEVPPVADEWTTPIPMFGYYDALYGDADGKMSRDHSLQHAAAQAKAANDTAGTAVEQLAALRAQHQALMEKVNDMAVRQAAMSQMISQIAAVVTAPPA